jgi:PAS domain S-box-containing protein
MPSLDTPKQSVVRALSTSGPGDDVYAFALAAIGPSLGWQFGAAWEPTASGKPELVCVGTWTDGTVHAAAFEAVTRDTTLAYGQGLPGRVWEVGAAPWVTAAADDQRLPRRLAAARSGLHTAVCFPVRSERGFLGAIELFASIEQECDERLLATMDDLGLQVGQLLERRRAEEAVHAGEQRLRAVLDAALDCVVIIDHEGQVLEFNPAAERVFGISAEAAQGREMAELIVPPEMRERHRAGLRRCVAGEASGLLDMRIETQGLRVDGTRFPVELTITRIAVPGPPLFTGYLRDITERRRAEDELRESRARIVEAADAARRRIERDLHDGAQQHLVGVGLSLRLARQHFEAGDLAAIELLDDAIAELTVAADQLRELARGIHPAVLVEGGLEPALRGLMDRCPVPSTLVEVPDGRFDAAVEATAYFVVAEALTNVARYAEATHVDVSACCRDGALTVEVRDDGRGGADPSAGTGLRGLGDRLAARNGTLQFDSRPGSEPCSARVNVTCNPSRADRVTISGPMRANVTRSTVQRRVCHVSPPPGAPTATHRPSCGK